MSTLSILAVDDSETMRQMVTMTLRSDDYRVVLAKDGIDGLDKFSSDSFDLVITDINMPKMDGIGLITAIRLLNKDVPILALTTESESASRQRGADAGASGWIVKPFKPQQFCDIVRQII
jgi:two-component system, chemotaxis family, chemotaxis protein CheY